ncbi:unnamed protein product [Gongylonema pulchrum]|uniref:Uncharacterized protein n=1 Tax=Gongylonema pulchrum TaxID=637853 RepID=A0A183E592_9BILA|nr:unnamed protein product [Gongylonema pulchrum]
MGALSAGIITPAFFVLYRQISYCRLIRVLKNRDFAFDLLSSFVEHCLTCPALLIHLSVANIDFLVENKMFEKAITVLVANLELTDALGGSRSLFLLANLIHLSYLDQHGLVEYLIDWTDVMNRVLIRWLWKKLNIIRAEAQICESARELPPLSMTAVVCQMYQNALLTLNSLHTDILSGMFYISAVINCDSATVALGMLQHSGRSTTEFKHPHSCLRSG